MKSEHWFAVVIGFAILAYVLDSVVNPLALDLPTPYHFFTVESLSLYPFTTVSLILKSVALTITPILILSMLGIKKFTKGIVILILSGLYQLYSLQDVATNASAIPLEWDLALSLSGIVLILISIVYLVFGIAVKASGVITDEDDEDFRIKRDDS